MKNLHEFESINEWGPVKPGQPNPQRSEYNIANMYDAAFAGAQEAFFTDIATKMGELGATKVKMTEPGKWTFNFTGHNCVAELSGNQRSIRVTEPNVPGAYSLDLKVLFKKIEKF